MLKRKFVGLYILLIIAFAAVPSFADTYFKQVTHIDEVNMMGQIRPAQTDTVEIWITGEKMWMRQGAMQSAIMDIESGTLIMLDHSTKTQFTMSLDYLKDAMKELSKEAGSGKVDSAMEMIFGDVSVSIESFDETKQFGEWKAKKYIYTMNLALGKTTTEIWACPDIKINQAMYLTASNATMANMPWFQSMMDEWKKVDGMPVYTESVMEMMGQPIKSTTTLIETKEGTIPAGLLEIPEGYKETTAPMMPGLK